MAAAWRGPELLKRDDWFYRFSSAEIAEFQTAIGRARATGKPTIELSREDFPLPTLGVKIAGWRRELDTGRGLQTLGGIPVERWKRDDVELFFWCFGLHLGLPGTQNPQGDLLGNVRDQGVAGADGRLYKTAAKIAYHCDAADVVGLLCINKAKRGGLSRIVSSVSVYNELLRRRPDLIERLYRPFWLNTWGEGGINYFAVTPCRYSQGRLRTFYHSDYFRSVVSYDELPDFTPEEKELLDLFEEIALSPDFYLDQDLQPGDIQLISNHTVLHSRTEYEDFEAPDKKRNLLRLWISLPRQKSFKNMFLTRLGKISLIRSIASQKLRARLR